MAVIIITKEIDIAFDAYLDGVIDHDLTGNPMTRRTRGITTESIVTFAAGYQSTKHAMSKACPIKPITSADVTDSMLRQLSIYRGAGLNDRTLFIEAVNVFIKECERKAIIAGDKDESTS